MARAKPPDTAALLRQAIDEIDGEFFERREVIELMFVTLLSRNNVYLLGVPGVAKSELSRRVAQVIKNRIFYDVLFDSQIGLAEYFGQWDPILYKQRNLWRRNTVGKMPRAHIVFGDEEGKAGPNVLNPLLTLMNEHKFHNGCSLCGLDPYTAAPHDCDGEPVDAPLLMFVGASNEELELPKLEALWDRHLTHIVVQPIQEPGNFLAYLRSKVVKPTRKAPTQVELKDLVHAIEVEVQEINVPDSINDNLMALKLELQAQGIQPSDRRWGQVIRLLQAQAYLFGRDTVDEEDIAILQHALWDTQAQIPVVTAKVMGAAGTTTKWALDTLVELQKHETRLNGMTGQSDTNKSSVGTDINHKLRAATREYQQKRDEAEADGRSTSRIDQVYAQIFRLKIRVAVELLGMDEKTARDRFDKDKS